MNKYGQMSKAEFAQALKEVRPLDRPAKSPEVVAVERANAEWKFRLRALHAESKKLGYRYIPEAKCQGGIYLTRDEQNVLRVAFRKQLDKEFGKVRLNRR